MTIVYTVGAGSRHDDVELKWSLRSIARNGRGVDRVIVVGHIPDFINRSTVECIEMDDPTGAKHFNIYAKAKRAVEELKLTEEFLVSSDDHIYTGMTDFSCYPRLYQGPLKSPAEYPADKKFNAWRTSLFKTLELMKKCGLPTHNTRGHFNTYFDPKYLEPLDVLMTTPQAPDVGFEHSLLINNLKLYHEPHLASRLVKMSDCKLDKLSGVAELNSILSTRSVISIGDNVFTCPGVEDEFNRMFPDKCVYEA